MKSGRTSFTRWLIAAGILASAAAWFRRLEPRQEPGDAPLDEAAAEAGAFEIELTRARRAPRTRGSRRAGGCAARAEIGRAHV